MTRYNYLMWIRLLCPILLIDSSVLAAMAAEAVSFVPLPLNSLMPIAQTLAEIESTYNVERLHTFDQKQKAKMLNPASFGPFSHQRRNVSEKDNVFDRYSPPSIPYDREVAHKARQDFFNIATDDAFVSPDQADQKHIPNEFPSKPANIQTFNTVLTPASMPEQVPLGMPAAEYPDRPYHDSVAGRERRALTNSPGSKPIPTQPPTQSTTRYVPPAYYKYQRAISDYLFDFETSNPLPLSFLPDPKSFDGKPNRMLTQYWGINRHALKKSNPSLEGLLSSIVYSPHVHKHLIDSGKLVQRFKKAINYLQLDIQSTSNKMIAATKDPDNPASAIQIPIYQKMLSWYVQDMRGYIADYTKARQHDIWTTRCASRCNTQTHYPDQPLSIEEEITKLGSEHRNYFSTNEATMSFLEAVNQNKPLLIALQYAVHNAQLYIDYLIDHKHLPESLVTPAYDFISILDKYHENIGMLYEYAKSHVSQPPLEDQDVLDLKSLTDQLFKDDNSSIYTQFRFFADIAAVRYTHKTQTILNNLAKVAPAQVDIIISPVIAEATQVVDELTDIHSYFNRVQTNYAKSQDRLRHALYDLNEAQIIKLYNMIPDPKPTPDTPAESRPPNQAQSRRSRSINSSAPNTNTDTNTNISAGANTSTDTNTSADANTSTDINTNTSTDINTNTSTDTNINNNTKNDTPTASNSNVDTNTDINPDTHTNSNQLNSNNSNNNNHQQSNHSSVLFTGIEEDPDFTPTNTNYGDLTAISVYLDTIPLIDIPALSTPVKTIPSNYQSVNNTLTAESAQALTQVFIPHNKDYHGDPKEMLKYYWGLKTPLPGTKPQINLTEFTNQIIQYPHVVAEVTYARTLISKHHDRILDLITKIITLNNELNSLGPNNPRVPQDKAAILVSLEELRQTTLSIINGRSHVWYSKCAHNCFNKFNYPDGYINIAKEFSKLLKKYHYQSPKTRNKIHEILQDFKSHTRLFQLLHTAVQNSKHHIEYLINHKYLPIQDRADALVYLFPFELHAQSLLEIQKYLNRPLLVLSDDACKQIRIYLRIIFQMHQPNSPINMYFDHIQQTAYQKYDSRLYFMIEEYKSSHHPAMDARSLETLTMATHSLLSSLLSSHRYINETSKHLTTIRESMQRTLNTATPTELHQLLKHIQQSQFQQFQPPNQPHPQQFQHQRRLLKAQATRPSQ
ncbi:hypothetical protein NEHOM01_2370 [Nematocida homosporus]|uniref:uncharacterized protein n=1 Tax=Nematocida homosporus TaxID=1912981 RepID=UPI00221E8486|nr:uncharacterized protein NEHOM01_2370 [Nematocida homosporus]KAI5187791.1 hypothetical protein NEHOM01_2370 [Nematocida homosporus]